LENSKYMKETKIYKIWFQDGRKIFFHHEEIDEMAKRFGFYKKQLLAHNWCSLMEDGEIIGGVHGRIVSKK